MKVLVVDDVPENRSILAQFLSRMGHRPLEAKNGEEAVALFEAESPDFVIMDVLMPVMDGFDATRRIKALSKDRWTPVLLLTALNRADHLIRGLEMGGDDFISKPFDFSLLTAKIRVFERALALQSQILEKNASLRAMGARIEEEMLLGKHVLDALVAGDRSQEPCVEFWVEPLELFGGDIVLRRRAPDGTLFLFHADSQGHGLSAALGLFPATEVFHAMVDRGFDAEMTLTEMNRKIRELMPPGFFIAVTAVSLSPLRETLSVVNCGNPPAVLIDGRGEVMRRFLSKAPPLGVLGSGFSPEVETIHLPDLPSDPERRLYFFSDGLAGAMEDGDRDGVEQVIDLLCRTPREGRLDVLREIALRHPSAERRDDMSLLSLCCAIEPEMVERPLSEELSSVSAGGWRLSLDLSAEEIRRQDLLPRLMEMLNALGIDYRKNDSLFVVLGELLSNALDHGILRLDSSLKEAESGFERYDALRRERLEALVSGSLHVEAGVYEDRGTRLLRLRLRDSGPGFDFHPYLSPRSASEGPFGRQSGRGLSLVRAFCDNLTIQDPGNDVIVTLKVR